MRSENVLIPRSISIHAPPRGATNQPPRVTRIGIISIHAPPRGATWSFPPSRDYPTFQFTPLREGRRKTKTHFWRASTFQFTPLREGRPFPVATRLSRSIDFNSRPSARGDALRVRSRWLLPVHFNSRPSARGDGGFPAPVPRHSFQFTPLREGRRIVQSSLVNRNRFQFTPLREGRLSEITEAMNMLEISIHAPPRGATLQVVQ